MVPKQKGEISKRSGGIKKRRSSCEDYGQQASQSIVQAFGNLTKTIGGALILKLLPFPSDAHSPQEVLEVFLFSLISFSRSTDVHSQTINIIQNHFRNAWFNRVGIQWF